MGVTHEDARDALGALALDALDALERAAVLAHVADCASCRDELNALRETGGKLAYAVPPLPMTDEQRDRIRARLMTRAASEPVPASTPTMSHSPIRILEPSPGQTRNTPHRTTPHRNTPQHSTPVPPPLVLRPGPVTHDAVVVEARRMEARAKWIGAAAITVAVVTTIALVDARSEASNMREQLQMVAVEARADLRVMDSLRRGALAHDRMIANITGPEVVVVTLAAGAAGGPSARMFWDQSRNAWTFVAHNLLFPRSGRVYQVWLVTAAGKISVGTFNPGPNGDAVVQSQHSLGRDALTAVSVTDEPTGGSAQPTTAPVIAGFAKGR